MRAARTSPNHLPSTISRYILPSHRISRHPAPPAAQIFAVLQWDEAEGLPAALVAEKMVDLDFASVVTARPWYHMLFGPGRSSATTGYSQAERAAPGPE